MKRLLLPLFMIVMLAIGTLGAYAYFDSARETTGHISAGDLVLKLGLTAEDISYDTVPLPWDFTNMAPGDYVEGKLHMKNVGTIPAKQLTFEWHNILNDPETLAFAEQIILTSVMDSTDSGDAIAQFNSMCDGADQDLTCNLAELAALSEIHGYPFDAYSDGNPFLPSGTPRWLYMKFQFNPDAGNEFQGASLSYGLTITAEQVSVFP